MKFVDVCIESLGYVLPSEIWTSADIECRLEPLYQRLKLPPGRLELMTGIRERRFWEPGVRPSENSVRAGNYAIEAAGLPREMIGCLIHASVCRDFLEPATACTVHQQLQLGPDCHIFDLSNACLGVLNGVLLAASMIELQQIPAALIVGSEGGRQLLETTIAELNRDTTLTRQAVKPAFASLTIGSASCALLLTHRSISKTRNPLMGAAVTANTQFHDLCQSSHDQAGHTMSPLMQTDSEALLLNGVETGVATMPRFLKSVQWEQSDIQKTVCHQVGSAHRKLMLEKLGIDSRIDFPTYSWLGNTGSAALPVSWAIACEQGFIQSGDHVALLGIGSGINCVMLGIQWNESRIASNSNGEPPSVYKY